MYYWMTWVLLIAAIVITAVAQGRVTSTYNKYSQVESSKGQSAAQVARSILNSHGLTDVPVEMVAGDLTDHYDPSARVLRLSEDVYGSDSVAAIGIAAHESGHAIQHQEQYGPLKVRTAIVPVVSVASKLSWVMIIIGLLLGVFGLAWIGVLLFSAAVVFQLVTLPVEFNASKRALVALEGGGYLDEGELAQSKKVLTAAALTYVAALLASILQLARLLMIVGGSRR